MSRPLRDLKGVGEKTEKLFGKLGITDVEGLLHYYPRNYDAYQVYYGKKAGSKSATTRLATTSKLSYSKSRLSSGKTYYFRVRAYKKVNGKNVYGEPCTVKGVKIK